MKKKKKWTGEWKNNIKERKDMGFASSIRAAEDRPRWKRVVAKSFVVPQMPCKALG